MSASAGKVLLTPKGDFSTSATYSILDWVRYNGGVYVAKQTTTGNLPTNTTYWEKMIDSVSTLSGLSDVNITNIADGETLIWDATNSEWVNGTITGGGSYITLTTTTEQGENVSMSIGGATYTGTFSSQGVCRFEGVKETGTATISTARVSTTLEIEYYGSYVAVVNYISIYGVEWDGTSTTAWTRTDGAENFTDPVPYYLNMTETPSSPFDDIMPWSGMTVEERTGGTMVKIPKFWYKLTQNGAGLKIQISNEEVDGFDVSPAHMDRGDGAGERDYVYVGRYLCGSTNRKSDIINNTFYIKSGTNLTTMRTNVKTLGSNYWIMDFATRFTIYLLYLVEYADWNSQTKIGVGSKLNDLSETVGTPIPYHTGTSVASRTGSAGWGYTQYRNIRDLWSMVQEAVDGCYVIGSIFYVSINPSQYADYNSGVDSGGVLLGYPTEITVTEPTGAFKMFVPTNNGGDGSTYVCDEYFAFRSNSSYTYIVGGGLSSSSQGADEANGLFPLRYITETYQSSINGLGYRLMELPDNT